MAAKKVIRILLVDDHNVLREGLRSLLERQPGFDVVADTGDGQSALTLARALKPDVVVMDISMPGLNGVDATQKITGERLNTRVLCLSVHRERPIVEAMLQAGASGYLLKTSAASELVEAVRIVAGGETYLCPVIAADMVDCHVRGHHRGMAGGHASLTARERQILQLIAGEMDTKEIADRLKISAKTVLAHRENLMRKLGLHSTVALARYALREGLVQL